MQLGGGTDINAALGYCEPSSASPATPSSSSSATYEGGDWDSTLSRAKALVEGGVQMVALLALSDSGAPGYSSENAAALAELGVPALPAPPSCFRTSWPPPSSDGAWPRWAPSMTSRQQRRLRRRL